MPTRMRMAAGAHDARRHTPQLASTETPSLHRHTHCLTNRRRRLRQQRRLKTAIRQRHPLRRAGRLPSHVVSAARVASRASCVGSVAAGAWVIQASAALRACMSIRGRLLMDAGW